MRGDGVIHRQDVRVSAYLTRLGERTASAGFPASPLWQRNSTSFSFVKDFVCSGAGFSLSAELAR